MTSVNQLKLASGAGEPDNVLALRIDIIKAATDWYDVVNEGENFEKIDIAENALMVAIRRYKTAIKKRAVVNAAPWLDAT